ncbi:hypothetical protein HHI36_022230 [Cryptolaemus montrouzieri]|uniref:ODAD1 central coiled coil region domain-containing protein n=1 Tax=Cryptolaemus montrouzieri TaxID=559131 RepID=A0ABD2MZY4_9CUCU
MEGDRKAFFEEMNTKLVKQRAIIQTLRNEKNQLMTDLKVATSASKKKHFRVLSAKINQMYANYEIYLEAIEKERHDLKEINGQIRKLEKKIDQLRGNDVTENQFKMRLQSGKKSIELLENKLQTSIKRFCTVLTGNKILREELDHLLKERDFYSEVNFFFCLFSEVNTIYVFLLISERELPNVSVFYQLKVSKYSIKQNAKNSVDQVIDLWRKDQITTGGVLGILNNISHLIRK